VRLSAALLYRGRFSTARDNLSEALALCAQGTHVLLDVAVAFTPEVSTLSYLAPNLAHLGYAEQAAARAEQAIQRARELGPIPLAFALQNSIRTSLARRDDVRCHEVYKSALDLSDIVRCNRR
jgi:hypothetical protein